MPGERQQQRIANGTCFQRINGCFVFLSPPFFFTDLQFGGTLTQFDGSIPQMATFLFYDSSQIMCFLSVEFIGLPSK